MVKQIRMFVIIFSLCVTPFFVCAESKFISKNHSSLKKFSASYIITVLLGSGVGVATGTFLTYVEKALLQYIGKHHRIDFSLLKLLVCLIGWSLEAEIRNDIVAGLQGDLDAYQMQYKKNVMFRSAWIASWLAYLKGTYILET